MRKKTKEEFVAEAQMIHNFKYTYDNFIYEGTWVKSWITCPELDHGDFLQTPNNHLHGVPAGCPKCGRIAQTKKRSHTTEIFIQKAIKIHGNKFSYILVIYKNSGTKVNIICNTCNKDFWQRPECHLDGDGCSNCAKNKKRDAASFIAECNRIHNFFYDYSLVVYVNCWTPVIIICPIHGQFSQLPTQHLNAEHGCQKCGGTGKLTLEEVIERSNKIHNSKYTYGNLIFSTVGEKGWITCSTHGDFDQKINDHLRGIGCPQCGSRKNEKTVGNILRDFNIQYTTQYKINLFGTKRPNMVDYYIPSLNLIVEYNGDQHYRPVTFGRITIERAKEKLIKQQIRDNELRKYCQNNNINLLEIDGRIYKEQKLIDFLQLYFKIAA